MPQPDALHLARWTVTSGSNAQSRGAVVIEAGDHHWQASASGNGAVDALTGPSTGAHGVLSGHLGFSPSTSMLRRGSDTVGEVSPGRATEHEGARGRRVPGEARGD
jgi:hypothetical protein